MAAKRPNWPSAGCDGDVILRILTNGLGCEAGEGGVGRRHNCETVEVGRCLDNCGRVRYLISGGQFEGCFEAEDGGRLGGCFGFFAPRDSIGLEGAGGIVECMVVISIARVSWSSTRFSACGRAGFPHSKGL